MKNKVKYINKTYFTYVHGRVKLKLEHKLLFISSITH